MDSFRDMIAKEEREWILILLAKLEAFLQAGEMIERDFGTGSLLDTGHELVREWWKLGVISDDGLALAAKNRNRLLRDRGQTVPKWVED